MPLMNYLIRLGLSSTLCSRVITIPLIVILLGGLVVDLCPAQNATKTPKSGKPTKTAPKNNPKAPANAKQELNDTAAEILAMLQRLPSNEEDIQQEIGNIK